MRPATVWQENRTLTHHSVDRHMTDSCITRWRILSRFPLILLSLQGNRSPHTVANRKGLMMSHTVGNLTWSGR